MNSEQFTSEGTEPTLTFATTTNQQTEDTATNIPLTLQTNEDVKMSGVTSTIHSDTTSIHQITEQLSKLALTVKQMSEFQQQQQQLQFNDVHYPYPPLPYTNLPYYQEPAPSAASNVLPPLYQGAAQGGPQNPQAMPGQGINQGQQMSNLGDPRDFNMIKRRATLLSQAPQYFGKPEEDIERHLMVLHRYFKAVGISSQFEMFDVLFWTMKDVAQTFVQSIDPPPTSYLVLETYLRKRFGKSKMQRIIAYERAKQGPNQSISEFGDQLRQLSTGTNIDETSIILKFISSLRNDKLVPHLINAQFSTLEDAASAASVLQNTAFSLRTNSLMYSTSRPSNSSRNQPSRSSNSSSSINNKNILRCFHCGATGHVKANCPKLKRDRERVSKGKAKTVNEVNFDQQLLQEEDEEACPEQYVDDDHYDHQNYYDGGDFPSPDEADQISIEEITAQEDLLNFDVNMVDYEVDVARQKQDKGKKVLYQRMKASGMQKGAPKKPPSPPKGREVYMKPRIRQPNPLPGSYLPVSSPSQEPPQPNQTRQAVQPGKPVVVPTQSRQSTQFTQPAKVVVQPQFRQQQQQNKQQFDSLFPVNPIVRQHSVPATQSLFGQPTKPNNIPQPVHSQPKSVRIQEQHVPLHANSQPRPSRSNDSSVSVSNRHTNSKQQNHFAYKPPARPAVFPERMDKAKLTKPNKVECISKALSTPVSLPLQVQLGLIMMATKDPKKILDDCLASAKEAIDSLEVDVLEVVEVQHQAPFQSSYRQTLYLQVLINGKPCYGLVDTGAQISLITSALVEHLGLVTSTSDLSKDGFEVVGVNGYKSSTVRLQVTMTIGNHHGKRTFKQRLHVIDAVSYKLILGCDLLYFWGAELSIYKKILHITHTPRMQLPLYSRNQVFETSEYRNFLAYISKQRERGTSSVQMLELYEINSACRIAHSIGEEEQEYLGHDLNEVIVGTSPSQGVLEAQAMPSNSRVSYAPWLPHSQAQQRKIVSLQQARQFCAQQNLNAEPEATLLLRASNLQRALLENDQLINPDLTNQEKQQIKQVLLEYGDLLAFDLTDIQQSADFPPFKIEVTSKPLRSKPYRLTRQDQELVDQEVKQLKQAGMVEDSHSPWLSPTFVVRPSTHRARMVTDYRRVNAVTIKNAYPLPDILQLFDRLCDSVIFTTLDLKSGFYQIRVDPESVPITAMGTDNGLYQFLVVPFGLANAPSHFMHAINHVRQVEDLIAFMEAFVDDLCVHSQKNELHCDHLRKTFSALRKRGHKLAASKIYIGFPVIKLLGHVIGRGEVQMDPDKLQAINDLVPPQTIRQLRAFLGIAGYYRRFISNFAKRTFHLTEQLKDTDRLEWNAACQKEFSDIKQALLSAPILKLPSKDGKYRIYTDFCSSALSAILQQVGPDNVERVVQYASKKCKPTEAVLASAEGELLAVVFGLSKFRHYLAGRKFDLLTDSAAVTNLRTTRNLSAKLVRWSLLLADFDFNLLHKSGKTHLNADGISRALTNAPDHDDSLEFVNNVELCDYNSDSSIISEESETPMCTYCVAEINSLERGICDTGLALEKLGCRCELCKEVADRKKLLTCETCGRQWHFHCIKQRKPACYYWHCPGCVTRIHQQGAVDASENEALQAYLAGKRGDPRKDNLLIDLAKGYKWQRGLLYKLDQDGSARIFPGPARRAALIDEFHRRYMHMGASRLGEIMATSFYWPNLRQQVADHVSHCLPCQLANMVYKRRERLQGHLTPIAAPRQGWSLDLAADLTTSIKNQKSSFIVCVCDYTGYLLLSEVNRKSSTIAHWIETNVFMQYGTPLYIRTDQGSEFRGEFSAICAKYGVDQKFIERAAPWRNGRAERTVRTVKRMLRAVLTAREADDWPGLLPQIQLAINSAPYKATGMTPFELFYGEKAPPMIKPHEISGELMSLSRPLTLESLDQQPQIMVARQQAMKILAGKRLAEYHRQLEQQYAAYPVKDGAKSSDDIKVTPNSLVAIKNTQRGAWQTTGIGPFLVASIRGNTAMLQSLTTGQVFPEAIENTLPLNMRQGLRPRLLHNVQF